MDGPCGCHCSIRKFLRCNNIFAESDVATSSASVLDLVTIDCLVDSTDTGPLSPMIKHAPGPCLASFVDRPGTLFAVTEITDVWEREYAYKIDN